jgi:hypothetical protein
MRSYFRKQIFVPQDHGSWVFILAPLFVGIFAGKSISPATFSLIIAALAAFMLRQPVTMAVKAYSGRRSKDDLPAARVWILVYGSIGLIALAGLVSEGFAFVLYLAFPGFLVFAWHLWLVSRRAERRQAGVEILATGVLSLSAPAAYWIGLGHYEPAGWWLWLLTWLQSAASIVYAYLRLEQREQVQAQERSQRWKMGGRALLYTSFNLAAALILGWVKLAPQWIFIPFSIQWAETVWGITHPAIGWKPTRIGVRQLVVSILWTISFVIVWR